MKIESFLRVLQLSVLLNCRFGNSTLGSAE